MPQHPLTQEEKDAAEARSQVLRAHEPDLLAGLLAFADSTASDIDTIAIKRGPLISLTFRIRPLTEAEYTDCRERSTRYVRNKAFGGLRVPEDQDKVRYGNYLIYAATIDEDRRAIWDNKQLWTKLGVPTGSQVIDKLLRAGEKAAVIDKIDRLSGYGVTEAQTDEELEELAGN